MKRRGIGFASAWQGSNYHFGHPDTATVRLELLPDLRYRVGIASADLGQGIPETLRGVVSQALGGVPADQIDVLDPDTGVTPDGGATGASRQTTLAGNATLMACEQLIHVLKLAASELLESPPDEVELREGHLYGRGGSAIDLATVTEECRRLDVPLSFTETFQAPPTEPLDEWGQGFGVNQFSYATYMAEVEVDTDTGEVAVLRVETFVDAGKIVRPQGARMQIEGGVVMGLGHALTEEFKQREGVPLTDGLTTYLIPTVADAPAEITSDFVDLPVPMGGLGAKGLAELALVPIAPAIVNAIYDAVGARLTRLPATPERVLDAMEDVAARDRHE